MVTVMDMDMVTEKKASMLPAMVTATVMITHNQTRIFSLMHHSLTMALFWARVWPHLHLREEKAELTNSAPPASMNAVRVSISLRT
jgi:hypothetical protein